jgi:CRP-like cAMP-binding protein
MEQGNRNLDWKALARAQPVLDSIPATLRDIAQQVALDAGSTIQRLGDPVRSMLLVVSGEVRLIRRGRDGGEVILQRSRGGFIAEASLDSRTYHCDIEATEASAVLSFPATHFRKVLEEDARFRQAWRALLAREVRKLRAQCERLSLHTAGGKVMHYIESEGFNGSVTLNQTRKAWAAELGLTHEALYRTLKRLQDEGTLKVDGNRLEVSQ